MQTDGPRQGRTTGGHNYRLRTRARLCHTFHPFLSPSVSYPVFPSMPHALFSSTPLPTHLSFKCPVCLTPLCPHSLCHLTLPPPFVQSPAPSFSWSTYQRVTRWPRWRRLVAKPTAIATPAALLGPSALRVNFAGIEPADRVWRGLLASEHRTLARLCHNTKSASFTHLN